MSGERWQGFEVENGRVAAEIRKRGAPAHTSPNGPGKTILYYENPNYEPEAREFHDHAGEPRPAGRTRVTQTAPVGTEIASSVSTLPRVSSQPASTPVYSSTEFRNPLDAIAEDRETEDVPEAEAPQRLVETDSVPSVEDSDLDSTPDPGLDEGSQAQVETSPDDEEEPDRERRQFSFSELDARDKEDLEKLYEEEIGPLSELEGTGANGNVLKKDLIDALRTDR